MKMARVERELTEGQFLAIMAAILRVTGAKNLGQMSRATEAQWREAYELAGVLWEAQTSLAPSGASC
jgi:hypothetical protein